MKREFAMCLSYGFGGPIPPEPFEVRVMARAEGYAMVRRKGAMPFVVAEAALQRPGEAQPEVAGLSPEGGRQDQQEGNSP